jgi:putative PIN family toxin of toxin-antitoxin system
VRAVLDVNVLIAALLSPTGAPAQIVSRWLGGEFELIVSDNLLAELEWALAYSKLRARVTPEDAAEFVSLLRSTAVHAPDPPAPPRRSRDPGDDYLLALAESEKAIVVSGDQHLLELADRFPVRGPRDFVVALEKPQ